MTYDALREKLRTVAFTTTTPFTDDGSQVRYDAIESNVQTLYDAGARVFIPCGNTGEYYSLSTSERVEVVEATVDALPADATVIGGAGGSTKTAVDLLEAYEATGADAGMIMYPRHTYLHEEGLIDYYETLASATGLGIVVYKRGPLLTERVLSSVASLDSVVAVKYAINDVKTFSALVEDVPGDVVWLNGVAERFAPAYALEGAEGFTTGIGNFVPHPVLALDQALSAEDWQRAGRIRTVLRPLEDLREEDGGGTPFGSAKNVPSVKAGLDRQGLYGGPVREPLVALSADDRDRVGDHVSAIENAEIASDTAVRTK